MAPPSVVDYSQHQSFLPQDAPLIPDIQTRNPFDVLPFPVLEEKVFLTKVLDIDLKTKDNHVARDPRMLRLTGGHPFNSEPPLSLLYKSGFLTSAQLHFVRNHGAVPQVADEEMLDWTVSIEGMVDRPTTISLREIMSEMDIYTQPVTMVCAGNRRKEQNMVKKGTGFNWGAAGTSTSLWTGPMLGDIIEKAGPHKRARYVWMEGGDTPANGHYGTCIRLAWARDPERGIQLAYKQNGSFLLPDHGRPLRVVIPGCIGGRSVKWLKRLIVSDKPSDNWYHYFDNRVLPTMVTPDMAKTNPDWWKDERYAVYDLNLQSITCVPENDEILKVIKDNVSHDYEIKGFAYNGGGVRVGRVEVSLDRGKTWKLTEIEYPEDIYRNAGYFRLFGGLVNVCDRMSCFCWCFWNVKVKISELRDSKDILVRGMDERMVVQPRNMYWNVTSMLNNWWYRVAITHPDQNDLNTLKFEHPVIANKAGGWMDRVKAQKGDILSETWGENDASDADGAGAAPGEPEVDEDLEWMCNPEKMNVVISMEEFAKHENETNPWFVVKGHVFDGTEYLEEHPGGAQSITMVAGTDATEDFLAIHSSFAKKMLPKWHLGRLENAGSKSDVKGVKGADVEEDVCNRPTLLDPKKWVSIVLDKKEIISADSRVFSFKLQHPDQTTGLAVGKHLYLRLKNKDGKHVMRAYTPKSCHRTKGILEILIKVYFPNGDIPGGQMTTLIEEMQLGSLIEVKGPLGEFEYHGDGNLLFNGKKRTVKHFVMIAGGSGITPCYQVIKEIYFDANDGTKVTFFFGNRTPEDILCKEELDKISRERPQIKMEYSLSDSSKLPQNWSGRVGRITSEILDGYISGFEKGDFMVLVCGPPGMVTSVEDWMKERKVDRNDVVFF
ncbi:unnamed protein product [Kuraishia capsulata CBS 1993]|uniref:Nitrate reductase n=1 Tax=Kuraishia capsulata CBS 1993 TaxID=1382522 RepID=W6MGN4_9ASCO|nr:uncharacterized protein KUCA_T00000684001 [Kuraishia capsulata CBS 1993]CDK24718.1 unnamed protein product [Kuraishia capsulata CBS 1993]